MSSSNSGVIEWKIMFAPLMSQNYVLSKIIPTSLHFSKPSVINFIVIQKFLQSCKICFTPHAGQSALKQKS